MDAANRHWSVGGGDKCIVVLLLNIMEEENIIRQMDQRKVRKSELFKVVLGKFKEAGYDRTTEQLQNWWMALKAAFSKAKKGS